MGLTLTESDSNTIQLLYGFVLIALALILAVLYVGDTIVLTAIVAMLLIKDGFPNLIYGARKMIKKESIL